MEQTKQLQLRIQSKNFKVTTSNNSYFLLFKLILLQFFFTKNKSHAWSRQQYLKEGCKRVSWPMVTILPSCGHQHHPPGPPDGSNTQAQVHTSTITHVRHTSANSSYAGVCRSPLQGLPTSHQPAGVSYSNPAHQTLRLVQTSAIPATQSKINWLDVIRYENVKSSFRGILKGGEMFQDTGVCPARYQSRKPETGED